MSRKPLQLSLDDLNRKVGERLIWQEENQQRRTGWLELSRKFVSAALDPVVVNMSWLTKRGSRILVVKALIHSLNAAGPYDVGAGSAWERQSTMNSARDT